MKHMSRLFAVSALAAVIAGCGGANREELDGWMAEVKARDHGAIEPLPTVQPYTPYTYNAAAKRAPFDIPIRVEAGLGSEAQANVEPPDPNRAREELERFNLESLKFVGVWTQNGHLWALISDGQIVHKVAEGNYLGRNDGKIVEATPEYLSIIEKVANGAGGWVERPRTMQLQLQGKN